MPDNERLEREIEEILGKIEQFPDPDARAKRARKRNVNRATSRIASWQESLARQAGRISVSQLMLFSFLLILASFFFRGRPLPPTLTSWMLLAGVVLFVSALAVMVFARTRAGGGTVEQTWRGRQIRYQTGPTLADRVRHWWASRARR